MGRSLKFRAWNGECFVDPKYLAVYGDSHISFVTTAIPLDNFKISQFTGLLDKNGKEIYEGDICIIEGRNKGLVKWYDKSAQFGIKSEGILVTANDIGFDDYSSNFLELIGNIYEHPDLLTRTGKEEKR